MLASAAAEEEPPEDLLRAVILGPCEIPWLDASDLMEERRAAPPSLNCVWWRWCCCCSCSAPAERAETSSVPRTTTAGLAGRGGGAIGLVSASVTLKCHALWARSPWALGSFCARACSKKCPSFIRKPSWTSLTMWRQESRMVREGRRDYDRVPRVREKASRVPWRSPADIMLSSDAGRSPTSTYIAHIDFSPLLQDNCHSLEFGISKHRATHTHNPATNSAVCNAPTSPRRTRPPC